MEVLVEIVKIQVGCIGGRKASTDTPGAIPDVECQDMAVSLQSHSRGFIFSVEVYL